MSVLKIKDANNQWQSIPAIKGADGTNGTNGVDGYSPNATVSKSGDTATITITDKNGTTTATIKDGTDGTNGRDGVIQYTAGDNITIENGVISAEAQTIQYLVMPTASADTVDKIVQYIGETDNDYTNGYFYIGTTDNEEIPTYTWENINVQPGGVAPTYYVRKANGWTFKGGSSAFGQNHALYEDLQWIINEWFANYNNDSYYIPNFVADGFKLVQISLQGTYSSYDYRTFYARFNKIVSNIEYYIQVYFYVHVTSTDVYDETSSRKAYYNGIYSTSYLTSHQSLSNYLSKTNTTAYTPTSDYHPSTKKYVDDALSNIDLSEYLAKDNTTVYVPTSAYNPATKDYVETYANSLFASVNSLNFEVVTTLPSSDISTTTIYLQGSSNPYNMYVYVDNSWELIGTTQIDIDPEIITNSASTYTIATLNGNKSYKLGEITSLEIESANTFDRETTIYFTSGGTATNITIPTSIVNIGDAPDMEEENNTNVGVCIENKNYIVSVLNNIAVWKEY